MNDTRDPSTSRLAELAERLLEGRKSARIQGLRGAANAVAVARLAERAAPHPTLVVVSTAKEADRQVSDLRSCVGDASDAEDSRVRPFPHPDVAPYDRFSPQPFVVAQRMDVLHRLAAPDPDAAPLIVVAPWTALAWRVPSRAMVRDRTVRVAKGDWVDRDELATRLVAAGYVRQPVVEERGEIAVRGGIVDVFPPQRARPVRLELLGDEVESLREFDPASQRSQGDVAGLIAAPPREILASRADVVDRADALRSVALKLGVPARIVDQLLDTLLRGSLPPGVEALAPALQPELETIFDALPEAAPIVLVEPEAGRDRMLHFATECIENHDAAAATRERVLCAPDELWLQADRIDEVLEARGAISLERLEVRGTPDTHAVKAGDHGELVRELREARSEERPLAPLVRAIERWMRDGLRVVVACPALSGADRTVHLLGEYGLDTELVRESAPVAEWSAPGSVEVRIAACSEGFVLRDEGLAVITEAECFGPREKRRKAMTWRDGASLEALGQLRAGDCLVHAEHGIGVYRGLVLLELGRIRDEFLRLEYEGGDRLFVPVHRLNLVQRYVGADGAAPKVDKLGGTTWEKTKRAVKRSMRDMAKELLAVHAARELAPGFAFPPRDRALEEFEAAFQYEETPDQAHAIEDVVEDLARAQPMDRLVCGDVGYGKTEVAARAAFQAVMAGKQVAVLVPTTVLCQQHTETFVERFKGHPVTIESLSRFRSVKDAKAVLEGLATGRVDIVIGTHRLLQKSMHFNDLGLLVVDEEHRFGVTHKERIKRMRESVDVLTLTATPIPRTLQMAFSGIRDLSVINTPPADRLAIRTQVCRFDEALIREAILREVQRGGQVFFVHNRVQTIHAVGELIRRAVPEVELMIAHGQMKERELEDRMLAFMHGGADVLLSTTIIESGIDNPRANTILIDRADALGLAQLYQLRGRVGRSRHRAYAYLLIPGEATLTDEARRRLEAIQDLSELGSGFRLANMDLEIRGAGNLLGGEQSGNLGAVGYETYMELLEEAIEELRGDPRSVRVDPEIRLPLAARLPDSYVGDVSQRLVLYKRLAGAADVGELERLRDELLDRFGPLPDETDHLVEVIRLKIAARDLGVAKVEIERGDLVLTAAETSLVDPARLVALMAEPEDGIVVTPDQRVRVACPDASTSAVFERAHWLLDRLAA